MQYFDDFDNVPDCLYYPIEQVARIDLIDRNQTTYWGTNLKGGIIAITMKKGKALAEAYAAMPSPDVSVVTPLGYQTPAEFYTSDAPADYDISIEGVSRSGKIIRKQQRFPPAP